MFCISKKRLKRALSNEVSKSEKNTFTDTLYLLQGLYIVMINNANILNVSTVTSNNAKDDVLSVMLYSAMQIQ
jgi:hypothetical protein